MSARARRMTLTSLAVIIGWASSLLAVVYVAGGKSADVQSRLTATDKQVEDHEARLRTVAEKVITMQSDVEWIRKAIEAQQKKGQP